MVPTNDGTPLGDPGKQPAPQLNSMMRAEVEHLRALFVAMDEADLEALAYRLWPKIEGTLLPGTLERARRAGAPRVLHDGVDVYQDASTNELWYQGGQSRFPILNFLGGTAAIHSKTDRNQVDIRGAGGGADCMFDYLVSTCFASLSGFTEGMTFTSLSGCTFKGYSTVQGAFTQYQSESNGSDKTLFICRGVYQEAVTLTSGPTSSTLRVFGAGAAQWNGADGATEITPVAGTAFTVTSNSKIEWSDLTFTAGAAGFAVNTSGASVSMKYTNCFFAGDISGHSVRHQYDQCMFTGSFNPTSTNTDTRFNDCYFTGAMTSSGSVAWGGVQFNNCFFEQPIVIGNTHVRGLAFNCCTFGVDDSSSVASPWITLNQSGQQNNIRIIGCRFNAGSGADANGDIYIQHAGSGYAYGNLIVGCTFAYDATPYITSGDVDVEDWCITGNAFSRIPGAGAGYLESNTAYASVSGNFKNSTFGPNSPASIVEYSITGTGNVFFPGTSATGSSTGSGINARYNLYETSGFIDSWLEGALITPAATVLTLGTDGDMFHVGAGDFATIATPTRQTLALLIFDGVSVLTHGANLILQGAANFTAGAGDALLFAWEGSTVWREVNRHTAAAAGGVYSLARHVNVPDAAPGATITAGNQQGDTYHSGPNGETATKLYVDAEVAPGVAGLPVTWAYGDTDDMDTVASWTTIATLTLSSEKSSNTSSMTNAAIPASRLIRTDWGTIVGTPSDATSTLETKVPVTT